jgi:hypothetical protein
MSFAADEAEQMAAASPVGRRAGGPASPAGREVGGCRAAR